MQPYFLPYLGYFQLIAAVDAFVIYDDIEYTKRGWINRNRLLRDGEAVTFTLPLKSDSDTCDIRERLLADDFRADKLLNQIKGAYARAPHFSAFFPTLVHIVRWHDKNLFNFLHHSIMQICRYLDIKTDIKTSSALGIDRRYRGEERVLATCTALGASTYINAIGGIDLYSKKRFAVQGIDLKFLKSAAFEYQQMQHPPVLRLSILDVLMFNDVDIVKDRVAHGYELI